MKARAKLQESGDDITSWIEREENDEGKQGRKKASAETGQRGQHQIKYAKRDSEKPEDDDEELG